MQRQSPSEVEAVDALIVVDVQNAFVTGPDAVPAHARLISMVDVLLDQARSTGTPVIFLQNDGQPGAADEPFQPEWALYFSPRSDETVVRKRKDNGFDGRNSTKSSQASASVASRYAVCCQRCVWLQPRVPLWSVAMACSCRTTRMQPTMSPQDRDRRAFPQSWQPGPRNGRSATRSGFARRRGMFASLVESDRAGVLIDRPARLPGDKSAGGVAAAYAGQDVRAMTVTGAQRGCASLATAISYL